MTIFAVKGLLILMTCSLAANSKLNICLFEERKYLLIGIIISLHRLTKEILLPLYRELVRSHLEYAVLANCPYPKKDIYHLERIQRAATRWVKSLRDLSYEERLKELKLQSLEKRGIRNDLVLTHKIIFHEIDLEASKLFKYSRRPGLRRSSLRLYHQTGRTRRRRNSFACRVVKNWNRLPLAAASVQDHLSFKRQLDTYI